MLDIRTNPSAQLVDEWVPRISVHWTATTDAKCPHVPSSDDYRRWSVAQIKQELAQRKIRVDPNNRVKSAYIALLMNDDAGATAAATVVPATTAVAVTTSVEAAVDHKHQVAAAPIACQVESIDIQPVVIAHAAVSGTRTSPERIAVPIVRPPRVLPTPSSQPDTSSSRPATKLPSSQSASQEIAIITDDDADAENPAHTVTVHDASSSTVQKRPREQSGELTLWDPDTGATQQHAYMRQAFALKAARVDIEKRRLEMDAKRSEHGRELELVQLELAQEQLKQAKLGTQKIRVEWHVEQALHKKRLRDAGVSELDIAAIM